MSKLEVFYLPKGYNYLNDEKICSVINDETITNASAIVQKNIDVILTGWNNWNGALFPIRNFYIGKTFIRGRQNTVFSPYNPNTWKLDGIRNRYRDHVKEYYGNGGLVVVAVVTRDSIPWQCYADGYIKHQEEYALTLEKRQIQHYKVSDARLWNKTEETGRTDQTKSIAYAIYVAFSIGKILKNTSWLHKLEREE